MDQMKYNTALAKGQGIIEETLILLRIWEPGMSVQQLSDVVVRNGLLGRATAKRAQDLVSQAFAPRYLVNDSRPAEQIKSLLNAGANPVKLGQLFLIHTARANKILFDFICEVYWRKYSAGATHITKQDALSFLETAYNLGRIPKRWSEKMMQRVSSYLGGCLADFQLVENRKGGSRHILPFHIHTLTTLYLLHDLHFSGMSENSILENPDWRLFGLERLEAVREIQRVSNDHFIPQFSGELLRISWKYPSMEDAIHGIVR